MTRTDTGSKANLHWERVQELFSQAVELPESERQAFVTRECAGDAVLYNELIDLLAADAGDAAGSFLTNALGAAIDATSRDRRKALVGCIVGNYRLASVLGHGGTGTVYLAERADRQYSAQVAIKVVDSATMHGGNLGLRFRAERQILASLNHPNIARLIDAGETAEGQPYLAMEYVHGEPVDRYCDRQQLDLNARLTLFLEICSAVQYAHQNLIVHRDLKPANILVTADGAPKLLDFGIAKLLDAGEATMLALTRMNDRLLTPEYASPEQILGRQVTTASDVYALGVVLYELLTGLRPYIVPQSASQLELERSICVTDPQRPSTSVRRLAESGPVEGQSELPAIAMARGLTPEKLRRRLLGDIDAIVMRALRKEPERRYASVEQLVADVRRYLSREPVQARQGNWLYYSTRFVRRHAFGVSTGAAFIGFIIAVAIAMSVQSQRIAAERDRATRESRVAEKVSEFMLSIFGASDPFESYGKVVTARELLDQAGRNIRGDLGQAPEVRARLLEAIARAYRRQSEYELSVSFLEEALQIRKQIPDADGARTASVMSELANSLHLMGDLDGAERMLREALTLAHEHRAERSLTYAALLANLGQGALQVGKVDEARGYFQESLALQRVLRERRDPAIAEILMRLSTAFMWSDDLAAAEKAIRESVEIYSDVAELHPDRVLAESLLAEVLLAQNRVNEAAPLFERTLRARRTLFGTNSRQVADALDYLALIRRSQGLLAEAEEISRQALAAQTIALGDEHFMTAYFRASLASHLMRRGKFAEAEQELRHSLDTYARTLPPDHQYVASSEHLLGEVFLQTNRLMDAEPMLTAAMNRWRRTDSSAWRAARSASALGQVLYRQGRNAEAERYLTESYRTLVADEGADRESRARARERVTRFYTDRGEQEKLEELMLATNGRSAPKSAQLD